MGYAERVWEMEKAGSGLEDNLFQKKRIKGSGWTWRAFINTGYQDGTK